jgi:hypothetical protein
MRVLQEKKIKKKAMAAQEKKEKEGDDSCHRLLLPTMKLRCSVAPRRR